MNETLKKTLRHYIDLEYYANGVDEELQTLLEELIRECNKIIDSQPSYNTKAQYNVAYKLIKEKITEFGLMLYERLEEEAELTMKEEEGFLKSLYSEEETEILLQKENNGDESEESEESDEDNEGNEDNEDDETDSTNLALTFAGISLARILFAPIDGRDTAKQFAERTQKNILSAYDNSLRSGYLFGQKSEDIKNQINGKMKQISNGMQAGIQTAIPSFAKTTDRIFFLNNKTEVVYCAVLDGRTCIVCGNDNGLHFKSISEAPSLPRHARCRCCYLKASEVKEPLPTYEEYIDSLTDKEQNDILGEARYKYHKQGVSLERFVNNGKKLTLAELQQKLEEKPVVNDTLKPSHSKYLREKLAENLKAQYGLYKNKNTGIESYLNGRSLKKIESDKAINKSKANGFTITEHFEAANKIIDLYKKATLIESRPDKNNDQNIISIKRFVTPFELSTGKNATAYITVKETEQNGHKIYSLELLQR